MVWTPPIHGEMLNGGGHTFTLQEVYAHLLSLMIRHHSTLRLERFPLPKARRGWLKIAGDLFF